MLAGCNLFPHKSGGVQIVSANNVHTLRTIASSTLLMCFVLILTSVGIESNIAEALVTILNLIAYQNLVLMPQCRTV